MSDEGYAYFLLDEKVIAKLDGLVISFICQTMFFGIGRITQSSIVMLQYGLAKEKYNYGPWRSLADLVLCYGPYSAEKIGKFTKTEIVGNVNFSNKLEMLGRKQDEKIRVLYAPTWGGMSSHPYVEPILKNLAEVYDVTIKLHHNEYRKFQSTITCNVSDIKYAGIHDDLSELIFYSDCVISDYSGAAFDAFMYSKPLVLVHIGNHGVDHEKMDEDCLILRGSEILGEVVYDVNDLPSAIESAIRKNQATEVKNNLRSSLFHNKTDSAYQAYQSIVNLKKPVPSSNEDDITKELSRALAIKNDEILKLKKRTIQLNKEPMLNRASTKYLLRTVLSRAKVKLVRQLVKMGVKKKKEIIAQKNPAPPKISDSKLKSLVKYYYNEGDDNNLRLMLDLLSKAYPNQCGEAYLKSALERGDAQGIEKWYQENEVEISSRLSLHRMVVRALSQVPSLRREFVALRTDLLSRNMNVPENKNENFYNAVVARDVTYMIRHEHEDERAKDVLSRIGSMLEFAKYASLNESVVKPSDMYCFKSGQWVMASSLLSSEKKAEIFIPGTFMVQTDDWSRNRDTINRHYRKLFEYLPQKEGVVIIPRWHFHLKHCATMLPDSIGIGYHTKYRDGFLNIKYGPLPDFFSIDDKGYAGFSSIANIDKTTVLEAVQDISKEDVDIFCSDLYHAMVVANKSKYVQNNKSCPMPIDSEYVFCASQVVNDEVVTLTDISSFDLIRGVISLYEDSGIKVVVKRHPMCNSTKGNKFFEEIKNINHVVISEDSIHKLISGAKCVYVANSGVGIESLIHGKPVVTSGKADYSAAVHQVKEVEEIPHYDDVIHDEEFVKKFLYYYCNFYLCDEDQFIAKLDDQMQALFLSSSAMTNKYYALNIKSSEIL
ncbi:CDP-glycerol glycerophosphotransferase family protein [Halomonas heilongjiangensis]|nr:CDP-glycerol glycerophosphotransferase family protein [Halomonas heilongjiangensis]